MVNPTATENITTIKEARKLFNDVKSNLSNKEKKVIRRKLYKKEAASHFFKEREDDGTLTDRQRNVLRHIAIYSKNISKHLKNLKKNQKKSEKYGHDIDYLFNKKDSSNINAFQKGRILLNEPRSSLLYSDINKIKKQLYKKEVVYAFLKNKERNGNLTDSEKKVLKRIDKYLKNCQSDLEKLQKNQCSITYGLDKLNNEQNNLDYYMPTEIKSAFDGSYMLYESKGNKDARLSIDEYFNIIRPYLKGMIDDHKSKGKWKIQLTVRIIFISFTDANGTREMHTKSDNITIISGFETKDVINEFFNTFRKRYQEGLETKMRGSSFTFERIDLLEYHLHKISLNRGSSYIESPVWIKNKGVTINPKNTR